jgi:VRR-NUC domain
MPRSARVPAAHEEAGEQIALFHWIRLQQRVWPELGLAHHIPNGAYLGKDRVAAARHMARLKAMGLKPGVFDVFLPVARHGWHGLYIEMKAKDGSLSEEQEDFGSKVANEGYAVFICRSFEQAQGVVVQYLFGDDKPKDGIWSVH